MRNNIHFGKCFTHANLKEEPADSLRSHCDFSIFGRVLASTFDSITGAWKKTARSVDIDYFGRLSRPEESSSEDIRICEYVETDESGRESTTSVETLDFSQPLFSSPRISKSELVGFEKSIRLQDQVGFEAEGTNVKRICVTFLPTLKQPKQAGRIQISQRYFFTNANISSLILSPQPLEPLQIFRNCPSLQGNYRRVSISHLGSSMWVVPLLKQDAHFEKSEFLRGDIAPLNPSCTLLEERTICNKTESIKGERKIKHLKSKSFLLASSSPELMELEKTSSNSVRSFVKKCDESVTGESPVLCSSPVLHAFLKGKDDNSFRVESEKKTGRHRGSAITKLRSLARKMSPNNFSQHVLRCFGSSKSLWVEQYRYKALLQLQNSYDASA